MAIVLISNQSDSPTNRVIEWLCHFGKEYVRVSLSDYILGINFSLSITNSEDNVKLETVEKQVAIDAAWYRMDVSRSEMNANGNTHFSKEFNHSLILEMKALKRALYVQNDRCRWLSNYESTQLNKVAVLREAKNAGLVIPDSLITSSRHVLEDFADKHCVIICKAVYENLSYVHVAGDSIMQYVEEVDLKVVSSLSETFFPSFFQKRIPKEYDVRVFYLNSKCYSMAIFSQNVDFRADYEMHRYTPIKLPVEEEQKIDALMRQLGLNTGSLDFVKSSEDGLFYFLEVNPNGQFEMVSAPCNYYLEREIAKFLCCES